MGPNVDCWCLDRRRFKGGDRQDQWHGSLPGASGIQGIELCSENKHNILNDVSRAPAIERNSNWSLRLKIWEAT